MKKLFFTVAFALGVSISVSAQTAFRVNLRIEDTAWNGGRVSFSYFNGERKVYKSAELKNGAFSAEGTVLFPSRATISISTTAAMRAVNPLIFHEQRDLFIEGGTVTITGTSLAKAGVNSPGKTPVEFLGLQAELKDLLTKKNKSYAEMLKAIVARDTVRKNEMQEEYDEYQRLIDSVELVFMQTNPSSYVSLDLLSKRVNAKSLSEDRQQLADWYQALAAPLKETTVGKKIEKQIEAAYRLQPGSASPDFVLNDTLGNPIRFSSLRGKYVLLDFWASWCIPCRAENKTVVKAYEKFHNKNFTVLSVSLERPGDYKAWVNAIVNDKLTWPQVAALTKEENTMITGMYGIQSIPMNFLVDPQGKIIATYLRGEALLKKLEEVLL